MALSPAVERYLMRSNIPFEVLEHPLSNNSMQSAHSAHVSPSQLAKAVILRDRYHYLMCVLPSSHSLVLNWLNRELDARYELAAENELQNLFPDCEQGAVPALGTPYGIDVVWDRSLKHVNDIYLEGGDHRHLVHISKDDFEALMDDCDLSTISCATDALEIYRHIH
ncbi:aminoacyl-tRNA deacylase [Agaribacterium haliotis]|uniref:aminoacyl-tRNA deacylase n=1 Tax=Agaribacterium haliotis TaxID=2013869 RepID=UPI000BB52FD1|nr:YbaK/EbsC family protein [Agaribacterium haliotis]